LLLPPALDLGVEGRLVGQGLAPGLLRGLALLPLHHLDMIHGFSAWASAEVLPDDAALLLHAAVEIALVPALLPGQVYYLLPAAPTGAAGERPSRASARRQRIRRATAPRNGPRGFVSTMRCRVAAIAELWRVSAWSSVSWVPLPCDSPPGVGVTVLRRR